MMNKKTFKMNTLGIFLIILLAAAAILAMYYFYSPHTPISDTINVPLDAPAPLVDTPADTHTPR